MHFLFLEGVTGVVIRGMIYALSMAKRTAKIADQVKGNLNDTAMSLVLTFGSRGRTMHA